MYTVPTLPYDNAANFIDILLTQFLSATHIFSVHHSFTPNPNLHFETFSPILVSTEIREFGAGGPKCIRYALPFYKPASRC